MEHARCRLSFALSDVREKLPGPDFRFEELSQFWIMKSDLGDGRSDRSSYRRALALRL
jgi:hypothetical protein